MIIVSRRRARRTGTKAALDEIRAEFGRRSCVRLPGFIEPSLLRDLWGLVERAEFSERVHPGIGVEQCAAPGALTRTLELLLNDPNLLGFVSEIAVCGRIGCFEGRVYRMLPGTEHRDSWHSDATETRLVAISINLGRNGLRAAPLQIRRVDASTMLCEVSNSTPGDAVLFRIDPAYVHRVGPLPDAAPRTACAGWFRADPDFKDQLTATPAVTNLPMSNENS